MPATRFYLPASGSAAASPAFAALFADTEDAVRRPMSVDKSDTALATSIADEGVTTTPYDALAVQFVSAETLNAGTISGTFSLVVKVLENNSGADMFIQVVIRVMSGDGSTTTGTLYAGNTATTLGSTGDPNQEVPTTAATRIYNAVSLSSVSANAGDRIVVDIGVRALNTTNIGRQTTFTWGDPVAGSDYALTAGLTSSDVPWIEFSQDLFPEYEGSLDIDIDFGGSVEVELDAGEGDLGIEVDYSGSLGGVVIPTQRWLFQEISAAGTIVDSYNVPINPITMDAFPLERRLQTAWPAKNVQDRMRSFATPQPSPTWSFGGSIRTQAHYDALREWARKDNVVRVTDHMNRSFELILSQFKPDRKAGKRRGDYRMKYQMTAQFLRRLT